MEKSGGKISFGFSKLPKKSNLVKINSEYIEAKPQTQLIDSIEGSQVTFKGKHVNDKKEEKLIIPVSSDLHPIVKLKNSRKAKKDVIEVQNQLNEARMINIDPNESLEQKAARELMEDFKSKKNISKTKIFELPMHPDELPLDGAEESKIEDYEKVPIADYGKALLRGMGWKEDEEKEKVFDVPVVRPKGLGLGADKVVKKQPLLIEPAQNEILEIKRNGYVKVLAGKYRNLYGTIEGFDDGVGRVVVKLAINTLKIIMNEFMVQPISKQEFTKYGKILNLEKFNTYNSRKNNSLSPPSTSSKREKSSERHSSHQKVVDKDESSRGSNNESRREIKRTSSDSEDDKTYNRKYNEKYRSRSHEKHRHKRESGERKKSTKKHSKSCKEYSSPSQLYSSDYERKHKRKYKRSKHHRDRS